jgi:hypothetical protein
MFRNGNRGKIYLNENMTPHSKSLFWKTKNFAKEITTSTCGSVMGRL